MVQQLSTVNDYVRFCLSRLNEADVFFGHGNDNSWDESLHLVLHSLHLPSDINPVLLDASLSMEERELLLDRIGQRIDDRVPNAYILGEAWFLGIPFHVDERVLIPRSPIAELIEHGFEPWIHPGAISRVLDLCCGSGCIGIATAMICEHVSVDLVDISPGALEVAVSNIERHHLQSRVKTIESDLFSQLSEKYDLILSNPPYVDSRDLAEMPAEFDKEPVLGLQAGEDGLDIVRRILKHARTCLNDGGVLVVEVGNSWQALEALYAEVPFTWIEFENGGGGVFVLTALELDRYQSVFDFNCR
ncbi:MAG: 50S ribosomal protein L3 N(5)-glutamine methyltransferase [Gammaproteobacteria bacterium]|nr:MAG: 50S ribosomal protein L3 N(5)-glutamine methyltransferase [Pseudomonadota bacterium]PIE38057.1 MAG: 50S ribosomal protein L3 N(5)-glutamine methyltransferase [Gammaproteobacteria bacterium]